MDVDFAAAARDVLAGRTHVIFHVARSQHAARVHVFKAGENFFGRAPRHVGHHVQAPAVAHAHHQFSRAELCACIQNFIHQRQQSGYAFQRKPLAAQVTLLHYLLENIRADQEIENPPLVFFRRLRFHAVENPLPPLRQIEVVNLNANRAGINRPRFRRVRALPVQC